MNRPNSVDDTVEGAEPEDRFPDSIQFLSGPYFPKQFLYTPFYSNKTEAQLRREGFTPVGRPATTQFEDVGFPFGKRPARLAIILVNQTNPEGLMYDGISITRKGNQHIYQAWKKPK